MESNLNDNPILEEEEEEPYVPPLERKIKPGDIYPITPEMEVEKI